MRITSQTGSEPRKGNAIESQELRGRVHFQSLSPPLALCARTDTHWATNIAAGTVQYSMYVCISTSAYLKTNHDDARASNRRSGSLKLIGQYFRSSFVSDPLSCHRRLTTRYSMC